MTDAAVIADSGPAPDAGGAVINENAPSFNSPLGSQIPPDAQAKPEAPAKPASLDDSIDRAMAKAEAKAKQPEPAKADPKPEAKGEPKEPQARGEGGKFTATAKTPEPAKTETAVTAGTPQLTKQSFTAGEAPARFSDDAKKEWAAAPESVRRESERAIKELTEGFQKYKASAERDGTLNEFHEMAKASGKELHGVVREYVNMESLLRSNPEAGIEKILDRIGLTPRQYAEHILNRTPEQQSSQQDATIRELRQELASVKQQLGGVTQTIKQQQETETLKQIEDWKADKPLFEILAPHIADELSAGAATLDDAYNSVLQKHPQLLAFSKPPETAKEEEPAASSAAQNDPPPVQPDKGQKSINGAPSPGSTPAAKKRTSVPLDEALDRAFRSVG